MKTLPNDTDNKEWYDDRPGHHDDMGVHPERAEAEASDLEDAFNAPSADEPEYAPLSPKKLQSAEQDASAPSATDSAAGSSSSPEASLFTGADGDKDGPGNFIARMSGRKKAIAISTIVSVIGGGTAFFSISSGPLQFIHLAQLLQQFHLASNEDLGDGRMLKIYKWGKFARAGTLENTRLGIAGNKIAQSIDPKLTEIGIEKKFTSGVTARYEGTLINREKFVSNAQNGSEFRGLNDEEFKIKFKQKYNIDLTIEGDGVLRSSGENGFFAYFKNRSLNGILAKETGLGKISGASSSRVLTKRDGVILHPIKRADAKLLGSADDKFTAWLARQRQRINSGSDASINANGKAEVDEKGKPNVEKTNENTAAANEANAAVEEAKKAGGDAAKTEGAISKILNTKTGKVTVGATAIVGIVCAAKAISDSADDLKHDMVILPLIRTGMQAVSLGNQVMSGADLDPEELGQFSKMLNDPKTGSWANAKSIQAELGQPQTGKDLPEEASIKKASEGNMFGQVLDSIPGVDTVCDVAESAIGKVVTFAISITTPIATVATTALLSTDAAKNMLSGLVKWLAGSPIPAVVFGPDFGNYANYGTKLAAGDAAAAMGGAPLTPTQALEVKTFRQNDLSKQYAQKSFKDKYLDPYSADSLVAKIVDQQSPDVSQNIASFVSTITNPSKLLGFMRLPIAQKTIAASNYDYGFPDIGFPISDLNSPEFENPYENGQAAVALLSGPRGQDYIDKAHSCFGATLTKEGSVQTDFNYKLDVRKTKDTSSGNNYPKNCAEESPDGLTGWKKIRFYILDTMTSAAADCYQTGDQASCAITGIDTTSNPVSQTEEQGQTDGTNGDSIYILGDSLTVGMQSQGGLEDKLKGVGWVNTTVRGYCGRRLKGVGDRCGSEPPATFDGLTQVDQLDDKELIKAASAVVIGLGTNDYNSTTFRNDAASLIDKVRALNTTANIYWLNLYAADRVRGPKLPLLNASLQELVTSKRIIVIDWASVASPSYADSSDGIHPSGHYDDLADTLTDTIGTP